jgi:uncharacterized spore protein YtfJ
VGIQQLLESIGDRLAAGTSIKNVYGDPVTAGDRTVIPAAEVRYAFGGGGGTRKSDDQLSGGGGGRVSARPSGALEVTPEGARFIPFDDPRRAVAALALGFLLGVAVAALWGQEGIEVVKRPD